MLVLLLVGAVGGAFASILVPLCIALGAVENRLDRLLARGVDGGDVEEFLGGSRSLASQFVDQGFAGCSGQKGSYQGAHCTAERSAECTHEGFHRPSGGSS